MPPRLRVVDELRGRLPGERQSAPQVEVGVGQKVLARRPGIGHDVGVEERAQRGAHLAADGARRLLDHGPQAAQARCDRCRRLGIKATHQRVEIYRELAGTDEQTDATTVYRRVRRRIPAMSCDTVYRTLRLFEEKGMVSRVAHHGERARFDANMERHHHFVCKACDLVKDFRSEALDELPIPKPVETFGRVESAQVQVRGICRGLRARNAGRTGTTIGQVLGWRVRRHRFDAGRQAREEGCDG